MGVTFLNFNEAADFWRYEIGVNVIPINSRKKVTYTEWSELETIRFQRNNTINGKTMAHLRVVLQ
jgi:hypothetical protein